MLLRTVASRQYIVAASEAARSHAIRPGMTLAEARALCAHLSHADHEPRRDRQALEALARWLTRFTPVAALETCGPAGQAGGRAESESPDSSSRPSSQRKESGDSLRSSSGLQTPPAIFLDVTGCELVFNGMDQLLTLVRNALAAFHITARVAVAPTPGAAWAIASVPGGDGRILTETDLPAALAPLPPAALRLGAEDVAVLHHLGIDTVGQLMRLPRESLPARFGPQLLQRLDQATGLLPEPLSPLDYQPPIEAGVDFDGVVDSLESLWAVFQELITRIVADLTVRGRGARQVEAVFLRPYALPIRKTILLSRPSRDPVNLFNLLRCAMETVGQGAELKIRGKGKKRRVAQALPSSSGDEPIPGGFIGLRLIVRRFERLGDEQPSLLDHERQAGEMELAHLIERLRLRLGEPSVARPRLVESHIPERAWREDEGICDLRIAICDFASRTSIANRKSQIANPSVRPLHLFPTPLEVRVMVSPSHALEGRPVSFALEGGPAPGVHRIVHWVGPERIAGEWWRGRGKTRDYFDVANPAGKRFWIFRVLETGKWYLQGVFE